MLLRRTKKRLTHISRNLDQISRQTIEIAARLERLQAEIEPYLPERRRPPRRPR